jgi:hypothetical protein
MKHGAWAGHRYSGNPLSNDVPFRFTGKLGKVMIDLK